jgi:hypothetical protein
MVASFFGWEELGFAPPPPPPPHRLGMILKAEPESVLVIQDVLIAHHQHQQMRCFLLIFTFYIDHIK